MVGCIGRSISAGHCEESNGRDVSSFCPQRSPWRCPRKHTTRRQTACSARCGGVRGPGPATSPALLTVGKDSHLSAGHNAGERGVAGAESEWCCCLLGLHSAKQVLREPASRSPVAWTGGKGQVQSKI